MSSTPSPARKLASLPPQGGEAQGEGAQTFLPYGRQVIEEDDIAAVADALRADLLTTGPLVARFERTLASTVGAKDAVACANGTAALYIAARALGLGPGTKVVVPAITFAATASAPRLAGAEIVFADVDPETGAMRASDLENALARSGGADAVFPVHYAGQSCDMESIAKVARANGLKIVEDAAHALGSARQGATNMLIPVGANTHSDLTIFSFHPVKTVAMGEGGAVTANDPELIRKLRRARNHGITREPSEFVHAGAAFDSRGLTNPWYYEVEEPGFNFRIPDINCALGLSQLAKLPRFVAKRASLVAAYDDLLKPFAPLIRPLARDRRSLSAWHIYPVKIDFATAKIARGALMRGLADEGIGTQVHYVPLHRHPYYAQRYGAQTLPGADAYYAATLTLPLHAGMEVGDTARVVAALAGNLA